MSLDKAKDVHFSLTEKWKDCVQVKFEWWPSLKRMKNGMTNEIHKKKRWYWARQITEGDTRQSQGAQIGIKDAQGAFV